MTRTPATRVRLLVGTAVLVLGASPAAAMTTRGSDGGAVAPAEAEALQLLAAAAQAARERAFWGTQQVETWHGAAATSAVHQVRYEPVSGLQVQPAPAAVAPPAPTLDERLLPLLARRHDLVVVGTGSCAGRSSRVVEARRTDGSVAGRLWLDRSSGLALRREVYDTAGRPVLTTAFVDVSVAERRETPAVAPATGAGVGEQTSSAAWPSPQELPGGYTRVAAARPTHAGAPVQHLAWSDGLSTVSVFSQPGALDAPGDAGFAPQSVDASTVWVLRGGEGPERIVWNGAGQVFTLVSDAGHDDLLAVVRALPHDPDPDDGLGARLRRGVARVGSWLDPSH